tara:strand:+ start:21866 stop:22726 length:861 start_codon:yes stop_codon:yes gene_type:complete
MPDNIQITKTLDSLIDFDIEISQIGGLKNDFNSQMHFKFEKAVADYRRSTKTIMPEIWNGNYSSFIKIIRAKDNVMIKLADVYNKGSDTIKEHIEKSFRQSIYYLLSTDLVPTDVIVDFGETSGILEAICRELGLQCSTFRLPSNVEDEREQESKALSDAIGVSVYRSRTNDIRYKKFYFPYAHMKPNKFFISSEFHRYFNKGGEEKVWMPTHWNSFFDRLYQLTKTESQVTLLLNSPYSTHEGYGFESFLKKKINLTTMPYRDLIENTERMMKIPVISVILPYNL